MDHAVTDDQRCHALGPGPTQDAEHVVLLNADPATVDDLVVVALKDRGRTKDADSHLRAERMERLSLPDFIEEGTAWIGHRNARYPVAHMTGSRHVCRRRPTTLIGMIPIP